MKSKIKKVFGVLKISFLISFVKRAKVFFLKVEKILGKFWYKYYAENLRKKILYNTTKAKLEISIFIGFEKIRTFSKTRHKQTNKFNSFLSLFSFLEATKHLKNYLT